MTGTGSAGILLYLFESFTYVLWAEEVALERGIPVEVVPAPKGAKDVCGLALQALTDGRETLETLLRDEGIPFQRHE